MKSAVEQLSTYKSVHLNKKNVMTHFVGVPAIIWALMVWLNLVELPVTLEDSGQSLTLAMPIFAGILVYYFILHTKLAIGQVCFFLPTFYLAYHISLMENAGWIALVVFVIAWIFQFVGHHFEKAKPAFVDDLNQLLIGPLFMMAEVFFMLGGLKKLEKEITPLAIEKRRAFEAKSKSA